MSAIWLSQFFPLDSLINRSKPYKLNTHCLTGNLASHGWQWIDGAPSICFPALSWTYHAAKTVWKIEKGHSISFAYCSSTMTLKKLPECHFFSGQISGLRGPGGTDGRTNESPPVFYGTLSPLGPLPCFLSFRYTTMQSRALGIADHLLPLGNLLHFAPYSLTMPLKNPKTHGMYKKEYI